MQLFESADEAIKFYNSKRCTDNLGLTLPSQIRYVHYFETILRDGGETPQPEARILRGIRLHKCPYWIRPAITVLDHNGKKTGRKRWFVLRVDDNYITLM